MADDAGNRPRAVIADDNLDLAENWATGPSWRSFPAALESQLCDGSARGWHRQGFPLVHIECWRPARSSDLAMPSHDAPNRPRIVIVDDNLELAENIAEILSLDGYASEVFGSAEDALPAVSEGVVIVVTDYRLPGMTGAELVKRIRQQHKQLHAVVISAYTDERTVRAAREAGARFLPKPVDFAWLSTFVREFG